MGTLHASPCSTCMHNVATRATATTQHAQQLLQPTQHMQTAKTCCSTRKGSPCRHFEAHVTGHCRHMCVHRCPCTGATPTAALSRAYMRLWQGVLLPGHQWEPAGAAVGASKPPRTHQDAQQHHQQLQELAALRPSPTPHTHHTHTCACCSLRPVSVLPAQCCCCCKPRCCKPRHLSSSAKWAHPLGGVRPPPPARRLPLPPQVHNRYMIAPGRIW
jgi:hypothetical protein